VDKIIRLEAKHKELESHKRRLVNFRNQQGANQRVRYTNPYPGGSSSQQQQQQQQPRSAPRPQFVVRVPQPQQQQNQQGTRAPRPPTPAVQPGWLFRMVGPIQQGMLYSVGLILLNYYLTVL
ncbi:hypothetical protein ACOIC7_27970, partial [Klebsiella pneumoniae]|uniref:hypothetical protein n=1 Tax=Klebsiella pneumoniae TaxID=573 RepID=UPI003B5C4B7D